jgi:hypothetical protein
MAQSVSDELAAVHPRMLKAQGESDPLEVGKRVIGRALETAMTRANLTNQEAAYAMGYTDSAVLGRWISGRETPQFAKLWAMPRLTPEQRLVFRRELVIALAEEAQGFEITTQITVRRTA